MKVYHDGLMLKEFGSPPPYDLTWGWATSVVDDHDSSAIIIVAYGPRPREGDSHLYQHKRGGANNFQYIG
jgi:hypothetical protein